MKVKKLHLNFMVFVIFTYVIILPSHAQQNVNSEIKPPYLSEEIIYKPILVKNIKGTTFDPDGRTVYFVDYGQRDLRPILFSTFGNGKWGLPDTIESTKKYKCSDPFVSLDGTKIFYSDFTSTPPKIKVIEKKRRRLGRTAQVKRFNSFS